MKACLDIFIERLCELKHDLNTEFQTNKFFHDKILRSCRDVSTCKYACMKLSETVLDLISDLRSSIITETSLNKISKIYFIDKKYHTLNFRSNRFQKSRFQFQQFYEFKTKRCVVCEKEGCWSIKHFKNERDAAKKRFQNKYRERIDRRFEKRTNQYIFDYEEIDSGLNNDDELNENEMNELNHDMKTLIVDVPFFETFDTAFDDEAFITSFEAMKDAESILSNLINRSFEHSLTKKSSQPQFTTNEVQNSFVYVIDDRYSSKQFHEVMINIEAFKHSTTDYGQYLAYQKYIEDTSIDTKKARTINVQFDIEEISFIGSIMIIMPVSTAEFHVIWADTSFLLCLVDMNRLNIYLNNLTNKLIMKKNSVSIMKGNFISII